jgi:thiamine biosynthesis lipoprotein
MTYSYHHEAMNSPFEIHIAGQEENYARQAADAIFREVDHIESNLSRFSEQSDLARIRLLDPGQSLKVSRETMECLLVALWATRETNGAFDVTLGRGMDDLLLDPDALSVSLAQKRGDIERGDIETGDMALDLGGIGKGYSLDNTAAIVGEWGIESAMLTAGPSTALAIGRQESNRWSIGLNGIPIQLQEQAISASGKEVKGAHILDPRTGTPATGHDKAWAICPSAALADALSTAFMVMDTESVKTFCRSHEGIQGHVLCRDGAFISFA